MSRENKSDLAKYVGKRIRMWRERMPPPKDRRKRGSGRWVPHMTIAELAAAAKMDPAVVNRLELGYQAPSLDTLMTLAHTLGCPVADLLPSAPDKSSMRAGMVAEISLLVAKMPVQNGRQILRLAQRLAAG